jgi:hypothetical protein
MTPEALLARLVALFPEFGEHWNGPDNEHREADGSFTLWAVFAEFGDFVVERYEDLPAERLQGLGWLLSECMDDPESDLDEAASSGFLENIAGERFHEEFKRYLSDRPLEFFLQWDPLG